MKKNGFTLIETLAALFLVTFLAAGTAQLLIQASRTKRNADLHLVSSRLASDKLEELKSLPLDGGAHTAGLYEDSVQSGESEHTFRRTWAVEDLSTDLKRIVIRVVPEGTGHPGTAVVLLVSRSLGF